jgi:hypothetical protein
MYATGLKERLCVMGYGGGNGRAEKQEAQDFGGLMPQGLRSTLQCTNSVYKVSEIEPFPMNRVWSAKIPSEVAGFACREV